MKLVLMYKGLKDFQVLCIDQGCSSGVMELQRKARCMFQRTSPFVCYLVPLQWWVNYFVLNKA